MKLIYLCDSDEYRRMASVSHLWCIYSDQKSPAALSQWGSVTFIIMGSYFSYHTDVNQTWAAPHMPTQESHR